MTTVMEAPDTAKEGILEIFHKQQQNQFQVGKTSVSERKAKLTKLHKAIETYRERIKEAMYNDFRKHPAEVDLTEIYPITTEIKHAKKHLAKWMGKHRVATPISLLGSSAHVRYEPKGVVLIVSPWNFPFNLTFGPLVSAISAGNTVIIKPS